MINDKNASYEYIIISIIKRINNKSIPLVFSRNQHLQNSSFDIMFYVLNEK